MTQEDRDRASRRGHSTDAITKPPARKVVAFDDDAFILGLTERVLRSAGYEVRTATDLGRAGQSVAEFEPDLVLMDVDFGGRIDGPDAVSRLRSTTKKTTSWVLYSASRPDRLARWAANCGADDWIHKDGDIARFLVRIAEILEKNGPDPEQAGLPGRPSG